MKTALWVRPLTPIGWMEGLVHLTSPLSVAWIPLASKFNRVIFGFPRFRVSLLWTAVA